MADFMTDYTEEFVIAHYIHKGGEHSHTAVRTSESVDINNLIHLEIQGYAVGFGETLGKFAETLCIGAVLVRNLVVGIHPVYRLLCVGGHLSVG